MRTSDGTKIDDLDKTKSAVLITFTMSVSDAQLLESSIAQGTINLLKVSD